MSSLYIDIDEYVTPKQSTLSDEEKHRFKGWAIENPKVFFVRYNQRGESEKGSYPTKSENGRYHYYAFAEFLRSEGSL